MTQGDYLFNRVGICDLDGDGTFDYVIKQPGAGHGLDPGTIRPSTDTFKLEAYNGQSGAFMWRYDLGWNMNMGVWWTPFVTGDFDGDGKAEVALKMAPYAATKADATIADGGFVLEGPEYITVLDGMTGKEMARADWVERGDPARWGDTRGNRVNRNQIGVAKLDGKRLSILVARGTYTMMYLDAWNLVDGKLVKAWRWFGDDSTPKVRGQGAHGMHVFDFDGDGKEEVALGSVVVDDNGQTLWSNGLGHPDVFYVADIIIFSYRGDTTVLQKYRTPAPVDTLDGRIVAIADVLGDWREELILTKSGELRIATTTVPSTSRHVTLMQDPLYRRDVAHASMGYFYPPNTSTPLFPESFKERPPDDVP